MLICNLGRGRRCVAPAGRLEVRLTFDVAACRRFAACALGQPPEAHVVRAEPRGQRVVSFVLPLELCPTLNSYAQMKHWQRAKIKERLLLLMRAQMPPVRLPMLTGRPWARAVRFSSVECDADAAWCKLAVDRLGPKNGGLALIEDDRPSKFELHTHWERAPKGSGFVFLEVHSGGQ